MIYDGDTVSLEPSIGNWDFDCQSHYWIRRNNIVWSRKWSKKEILEGRQKDILRKQEYYHGAKKAFCDDEKKSISKTISRGKSLLIGIKSKLKKIINFKL